MFDVIHVYIPPGDSRAFAFADGFRTVTLISGAADNFEMGVSQIIPIDSEIEVTASTEVMVAVMQTRS